MKKCANKTSKNNIEIKKMNIAFLKETKDILRDKQKEEDAPEIKNTFMFFQKDYEILMRALSSFSV